MRPNKQLSSGSVCCTQVFGHGNSIYSIIRAQVFGHGNSIYSIIRLLKKEILELLMLDSNTGNHLTVCKQMSPGCVKIISCKLFIYKSYKFDICV